MASESGFLVGRRIAEHPSPPQPERLPLILNQVVCNFFHLSQNRASSGLPPYDYLLKDVWKAGGLRNDAKQRSGEAPSSINGLKRPEVSLETL